MFPIRDHNPSLRTPWVTWAIIALNTVLLVATMPWGGDRVDLWLSWALFPGAVTQGEALAGILGHMFLHAGVMHFAGNMLFLWIFGDNLEEILGHFGFALFYLAAGLAAASAQILTDISSPIPMVGASGAIAGVMGGYLLLFPRARVDVLFIFGLFFRVLAVPAWIVLGFWFGLQLTYAVLAGPGQGGVAYWAHAGGFAAGVILVLPAFFKGGGTQFWRRTHGMPPHPETRYPSRIPIVRRKR
jgi:membrane associated rhomboid family serine protease